MPIDDAEYIYSGAPDLRLDPVLGPAFDDYSARPDTGYGEARINDHLFPIDGASQVELARFQNKVTFGDPSFDSDPYLSAHAFQSWTGGMGNLTIKEGAEDDTYWEASAETRYPDGLTLPILTEDFGIAPAKAFAFPIADFPASDPSFVAAFDAALYRWNETTQAFVAWTNLAYSPVERGIEYGSLLYIPHGSLGYSTVNAAGLATLYAAPQFVNLIVWDKKLVGLTTGGSAVAMVTAPNTWQAATVDNTLPVGSKPRKLVSFKDNVGDPALYLITDTKLYVYAYDTQIMYETNLDYPKHPDQGLAAANFRGEWLFVSVGMGIHGYNGSIVTGMGPDGRHGVPNRINGRIVDMWAEYNWLNVLVQGPTTAEIFGESTYDAHRTMYNGQYSWAWDTTGGVGGKAAIFRWSNGQWHRGWESKDASSIPTWLYVSETGNQYRLWWGYGNRMYTQVLPVSFTNPKEYLRTGRYKFEPTAELVTAWLDGDMIFQKLASGVEVSAEDIFDDGALRGSYEVAYQTDFSDTWHSMGVSDQPRRTIFPFNNVARDVGDPFSLGKDYYRIRFRITLNRPANEPTWSPLIRAIVFKFTKIPEGQSSWVLMTKLSTAEGYKGKGNRTLHDSLREWLKTKEMVEFSIGGDTYRCRIAQLSIQRSSGKDERSQITINLMEIPLNNEIEGSNTVYGDMA